MTVRQHEDVLRHVVRVAQAGRDFFAEAGPRIGDPDVRSAFSYICDVKTQLVADLKPWAHPGTEPASNDGTSPSEVLDKLYADALEHFRPQAPGAVANALSFGEDQLIKLLERAFEEARSPALQEVLKSYYSQLVICRQAMWRLHARAAA
ncbi:MAG TPA: hypothetical protein VFB32_01185 [Rudaea sp.]|nr:hypothetical protein [Rudaea sp.]